MSEPEKHVKIGKEQAVYYVDVQKRDNNGAKRKVVGIGGSRFPYTWLEPAEALALLAWLQQERDTLERLAKEQQKEDS